MATPDSPERLARRAIIEEWMGDMPCDAMVYRIGELMWPTPTVTPEVATAIQESFRMHQFALNGPAQEQRQEQRTVTTFLHDAKDEARDNAIARIANWQETNGRSFARRPSFFSRLFDLLRGRR